MGYRNPLMTLLFLPGRSVRQQQKMPTSAQPKCFREFTPLIFPQDTS